MRKTERTDIDRFIRTYLRTYHCSSTFRVGAEDEIKHPGITELKVRSHCPHNLSQKLVLFALSRKKTKQPSTYILAMDQVINHPNGLTVRPPSKVYAKCEPDSEVMSLRTIVSAIWPFDRSKTHNYRRCRDHRMYHGVLSLPPPSSSHTFKVQGQHLPVIRIFARESPSSRHPK